MQLVRAQGRLEVCPGPPPTPANAIGTGESVTEIQGSQWESHEPCFMFYVISQRPPLPEWSCVVHWRKPFSRLSQIPQLIPYS